ncbi:MULTISPECIES: fatty acyl-AMP ligase [unclassified Amycolatopsis]|uniref:fatty acyl-AMP ligase n=1 Tax=unclassified Amycolatopsis TaxID=2618356 RepID=UPI002874B0FE|nr:MULTISPECIES: fatty acyl-AMP ligase [unclassified Amycolatopsis]MDS0139465.1 fatty acyl-AMP ligase [Amycolatopsis sp. 505]MDS0147044.1 fatty acyl-AMP ligase [Amycolatopsis sp. CM201R]
MSQQNFPAVGGDTLTACLRHWAATTPDAPALTFADFAADPAGRRRSLTWRQLAERVDAAAGALPVAPGDRVAVLCPQGPDYVVGFLAAIAAGAIAVPLFDPDLPGHAGRLAAVLADCAPSAVVTTATARAGVEAFVGNDVTVVAVDRPEPARTRPVPAAAPGDVAYLQYTSGSTRSPAGVVLTHANVLANVTQAVRGLGLDPAAATTVSWLPLFHDMGLVLGLITPLALGLRSVLMDPLAFIERPVRWLELLGDHAGSWSAAPNFAFHYCASRIRDTDRARLRLGRVTAIVNGAEPINPDVLDRFHTAFAAAGYRPEMTRPAYGLAEATVFVTTGPAAAPRVTTFDRDALATGAARPAADGVRLVACGTPAGQLVALVDPDNAVVLPDGSVGEIWVHGPNVGDGYWQKPLESTETFGARLAGGLPEGPWLRTGDLGVRHDGELYIAGRIKDLIIVDGRNHYPQDVEATAASTDPGIRPGSVAAFAVAGTDTEAVVVVAEHRGHADLAEPAERALAAAIRRLVSDAHGLALRDVLLVPPGRVPRTSSGKIARAACRDRYLAGDYGKALAR